MQADKQIDMQIREAYEMAQKETMARMKKEMEELAAIVKNR